MERDRCALGGEMKTFVLEKKQLEVTCGDNSVLWEG